MPDENKREELVLLLNDTIGHGIGQSRCLYNVLIDLQATQTTISLFKEIRDSHETLVLEKVSSILDTIQQNFLLESESRFVDPMKSYKNLVYPMIKLWLGSSHTFNQASEAQSIIQMVSDGAKVGNNLSSLPWDILMPQTISLKANYYLTMYFPERYQKDGSQILQKGLWGVLSNHQKRKRELDILAQFAGYEILCKYTTEESTKLAKLWSACPFKVNRAWKQVCITLLASLGCAVTFSGHASKLMSNIQLSSSPSTSLFIPSILSSLPYTLSSLGTNLNGRNKKGLEFSLSSKKEQLVFTTIIRQLYFSIINGFPITLQRLISQIDHAIELSICDPDGWGAISTSSSHPLSWWTLLRRRQELLLCLSEEGSPSVDLEVQHNRNIDYDQRARERINTIEVKVEELLNEYSMSPFLQSQIRNTVISIRKNSIAQKGKCIQIYFHGNPGVGKTRLVRQIAEILGLPFIEIHNKTFEQMQRICGIKIKDCQENNLLEKWSDADVGDEDLLSTIGLKMVQSGCRNPIIFIDEAESLIDSSTNSTTVFLARDMLRQFLNSDQREINLPSVGFRIDCSFATLILAGNKPMMEMDHAIATRFVEIAMPSLKDSTRMTILKDQLDSTVFESLTTEETKQIAITRVLEIIPKLVQYSTRSLQQVIGLDDKGKSGEKYRELMTSNPSHLNKPCEARELKNVLQLIIHASEKFAFTTTHDLQQIGEDQNASFYEVQETLYRHSVVAAFLTSLWKQKEINKQEYYFQRLTSCIFPEVEQEDLTLDCKENSPQLKSNKTHKAILFILFMMLCVIPYMKF